MMLKLELNDCRHAEGSLLLDVVVPNEFRMSSLIIHIPVEGSCIIVVQPSFELHRFSASHQTVFYSNIQKKFLRKAYLTGGQPHDRSLLKITDREESSNFNGGLESGSRILMNFLRPHVYGSVFE